MRKIKNLIVLLCGVWLCSSCISLQSRTTPKAEKFPMYSEKDSTAPSLFVNVDFKKWPTDIADEPTRCKGCSKSLTKYQTKVGNRSYMFSEVSKEEEDSATSDYNLQVEFVRNYNSTEQILKGFLLGVTMCLIPVRYKEDYLVTAKLYNQQGQLMRTDQYEDTITTVWHLVLLPISPAVIFVPSRLMKRVTNRMFYDFHRDNFFRREE